jgi:hypothetical protein
MTDPLQDEILAPFLVLLIGRLLNWADVPRGGGDPQFLTAAQTEALAAEPSLPLSSAGRPLNR